jgi:hypothetical protein
MSGNVISYTEEELRERIAEIHRLYPRIVDYRPHCATAWCCKPDWMTSAEARAVDEIGWRRFLLGER